MTVCNVIKPLFVAFAGVALATTGYYMGQGCPNRYLEQTHTMGQCVRMGWIRTGNYVNGTEIALVGENALQSWNTSSKALRQRYESQFSNYNFQYSPACLSEGASRDKYKVMTSQIGKMAERVKSDDCLDKAYAVSTLRSEARRAARSDMCDQNEVEILEERDYALYGGYSFPHIVGKYVKIAMEKCKNGVCDIKNTTCNAIMAGAEKTNMFYTVVAYFFR